MEFQVGCSVGNRLKKTPGRGVSRFQFLSCPETGIAVQFEGESGCSKCLLKSKRANHQTRTTPPRMKKWIDNSPEAIVRTMRLRKRLGGKRTWEEWFLTNTRTTPNAMVRPAASFSRWNNRINQAKGANSVNN